MTTEQPRYPDIEIYLKRIDSDAISRWLQQRFEQCSPLHQQGTSSHYRIAHGPHCISVLVVEKAQGIFTSLAFDSDQTPWPTDLDCAREAAVYFDCEVRCNASGWQEGDDPDEWLSISAEGEKLISWKG